MRSESSSSDHCARPVSAGRLRRGASSVAWLRPTVVGLMLAVGTWGLPGEAAAQGVHPVTGRQIAGVMGHQGAGWLERGEREAEERVSVAVRALEVAPGEVVADVGAGTGYYTIRLADRVGPKGRVFATDIQPEMLDMLRARVQRAGLTNVELVRGLPDDPKLPANAFDMILMVDVYHELSQPQVMLQRLKAALKPTGRLVLLEFRKEDPQVPIRLEHKMTVAEARAELEAEGYAFDKVLNDLPWQHILVFRPAPVAK